MNESRAGDGSVGKVGRLEKAMTAAPEAEVVRCFVDPGFSPPLCGMVIRWPTGDSEGEARQWELPGGLTLFRPAPERFGILTERWSADAYAVCLLWDSLNLRWPAL